MECSLIRPVVVTKPSITVHVYRSPNKRFVYRTVVTENDSTKQVMVRNVLLWYDHRQKRYRKRIELQTFDTGDDEDIPEFNRFVAQQLWN